MEEQVCVVHVEQQCVPSLLSLKMAATLADLKETLKTKTGRFYFNSEDQDYGIVKEEISDDNAKLPLVNGRITCWLMSSDSERTRDCRPSFHAAVCPGELRGSEVGGQTEDGPGGGQQEGAEPQSSQLESPEDSGGSRVSQSERSSSPRLITRQRRRPRKPKTQRMERSLSFSISDSTMSLNVITVTLNMEPGGFLGFSVVGLHGDAGIFIAGITKGGAVASDGRIQPGDMLLQVNDVSFENMSNEDAVRVLREIVHKPGSVTLTVAKCWDPNPQSFTLPSSEPVRPIDPAAWVSHTVAMTTGTLPPHYGVCEEGLSVHSDMAAVVMAMVNSESGLEVRNRTWLKIPIPNAVIGSDVVDWLHRRVEGFADRREARRYAENLLKAGFIRHTVTKVTFSEQCYYVFGDICADLGLMSLLDPEGPPPHPHRTPASPYSEGSYSRGPPPPKQEVAASSGLHGDGDSEQPPPCDPPPPGQPLRLGMGNPNDFFVDVM